MIKLTDEEIINISDNIACSFIGAVAESGLEPGPIIKRAIAQAQLKKVVEWLEPRLTKLNSHQYSVGVPTIIALIQEAGLDEDTTGKPY